MSAHRQRLTWGQFARGLGALLLLGVLMVGIPLALLRFGQLDLPGGWSGLGETLTSRDDGTLFLAGLTLFGWVAWARFAFPVLVEIPAHLVGRAAPALPGFGGPQRFAGGLVASVALLVTAGGAIALPAQAAHASPAGFVVEPPPASAVASHAAPAPVPVSAAVAPLADRAIAPGEAGSIVVAPRDTLRGLAAELLGHEDRWPELYEANRVVIGADPDRIYPGQVLQLPAPPAVADAPTVTVQEADTLGGLAAELLGDEDRWPELYEANRDIIGRDPDLIRPGQVLVLPELAPVPASAVASPQAAAPLAPPPAGAPVVPEAPPGAPSAAQAPETGPGLAPTPGTGGAGAGEALSGSAETVEASADAGSDVVNRVAPLGLAGLLAAGVLIHLRRRRRRQEQRRDEGQRIPDAPAEAVRTEVALRVRADREHAALLRSALRAIGPALDGQTLPPVMACHLTPTHLDLIFGAPAPEPVSVFTRAGEQVWRLEPEARSGLEALPEDPDGIDPLPGLVTVGRTSDGYLLINTEALGVTTYAGEPNDVLQLLRTAALELATAPWAGWFDLELVGVGFADDLAPLDRISRYRSMSEVLPSLAASSRALRAALDEGGVTDALNGRLVAGDDDAYLLTVVIAAEAPTAAELEQLTSLAGPEGGIAVIAPSPDSEGDLELRPDGRLHVAGLGLTAIPQQLTTEEYAAIGQLFATVEADPVDVAGDPTGELDPLAVMGSVVDEFVPPDPVVEEPAVEEDAAAVPVGEVEAGTEVGVQESDGQDADSQGPGPGPDLTATPPVEVRILGPVEISVDGSTDVRWHSHAEALVVLLATLGSGGAGPERLRYALGRNPDEPITAEHCRQVSSRARSRLGVAADGEPRLGLAGRRGVYHLHDEVGLDWTRFQRLVERARTSEDGRPDLRSALSLVRGEPFAEAPWWWVDTSAIDKIRATVVDAAQTLATLELTAGQPRAAIDAALDGMQSDPGNERLTRVLMQATHTAGDTAGVHRVYRECLKTLHELDPLAEPHPATTELYDQLTTRATVSARA